MDDYRAFHGPFHDYTCVHYLNLLPHLQRLMPGISHHPQLAVLFLRLALVVALSRWASPAMTSSNARINLGMSQHIKRRRTWTRFYPVAQSSRSPVASWRRYTRNTRPRQYKPRPRPRRRGRTQTRTHPRRQTLLSAQRPRRHSCSRVRRCPTWLRYSACPLSHRSRPTSTARSSRRASASSALPRKSRDPLQAAAAQRIKNDEARHTKHGGGRRGGAWDL